MIRKITLIFTLFLLPLFVAPEATAFEPASLVSAAPQAAQLAAMWTPHTVSALSSVGQGMFKTGEAFVNIFRLPLGMLQCSFGAPFGYFYAGCDNCMRGAIAPFQFIGQTLLLPVRIISLGTVR